jgi:hypothetical protein
MMTEHCEATSEKHWDPWKDHNPRSRTRSDFILSELIPVMGREAPQELPIASESETKTFQPIIPHRRIESPPWWLREAEGIETAVLWLTTWILSFTFVFIGLVVGFIISHLFELSMIIFGWSV